MAPGEFGGPSPEEMGIKPKEQADEGADLPPAPPNLMDPEAVAAHAKLMEAWEARQKAKKQK